MPGNLLDLRPAVRRVAACAIAAAAVALALSSPASRAWVDAAASFPAASAEVAWDAECSCPGSCRRARGWFAGARLVWIGSGGCRAPRSAVAELQPVRAQVVPQLLRGHAVAAVA